MYYFQALLTSTFILIILLLLIYQGTISPFWSLIPIGWMFFDLWKTYKTTKAPIIITNDLGLKINHNFIDNKLIYWNDIKSIKEGSLVKYKIIHKNGEIDLPI